MQRSRQGLVEILKSKSCSLERLATALMTPGGSSLPESLIRASCTPLATCGTVVVPVCVAGGDRAVCGPTKPLTGQRTLLWKDLKGDLEIAVPRVRGERARKGLTDSRSEVGDNPRGTPNPWARDRSISGRKTRRCAVVGQGTGRDQDAGKEAWRMIWRMG